MNNVAIKTTHETREVRENKYLEFKTVNVNDSLLYTITVKYQENCNRVEDITIRDYTDQYNLPVAYTRSKRGLKNVVEAISSPWVVLTWRGLIDLFDAYNIDYRSYCSMD